MYYFSFSLIIGGAIGNLIDRFSYNAVFDFIDLHYNNFHWYVFNIADITITVGCILTIILELFFKGKESQNEINK
jgi:signal peptidase II